MNSLSQTGNPMPRHVAAVMVISAFLVAWFAVGPAIAAVNPELLGYPRWALHSGLEIAISLLAVMALFRTGVVGALREMRLLAPVHVALLVSAIATLPMLLAGAATGPMTLEPLRLLFFAGIGPFSEEIVFRGLAFWMLYRVARWGFWPAALIPAAFFSLGHLYQAGDSASTLGILGITAVGSVWFSWLLLRWDNLWIPITMHVMMNGWWLVFEVDHTALGGWLANIARALTVGLSILLTIYKERWES